MECPEISAQLRPAGGLGVRFTILTGVALPLGFVGLAAVAARGAAGGSLIHRDGRVVGSSLLGQNFTQDRYFQGRPSATTAQDPAHPDDPTKTVAAPYNAASSAGANLGPTSKALIERVRGDLAKAGPTPVPGDMLTTSASGLDPDISPQTADRQVARVAAARRMTIAQVRTILDEHTSGRLLGLIGEPRVNVLAVTLALDSLRP